MKYFLLSTYEPGKKGVSTCKDSEVHRKVIDRILTLSRFKERNNEWCGNLETRQLIKDNGARASEERRVWASKRMLFSQEEWNKAKSYIICVSETVLHRFSKSRVLPSDRRGEMRQMSRWYLGKESNILEHCSSDSSLFTRSFSITWDHAKNTHLVPVNEKLRSQRPSIHPCLHAFSREFWYMSAWITSLRETELSEPLVRQQERNDILRRWTGQMD